MFEFIDEGAEGVGIEDRSDGDDVAFHAELIIGQAKPEIERRSHQARPLVCGPPNEQSGGARVYLNSHVDTQDIRRR
jgi:hypothetical protein